MSGLELYPRVSSHSTNARSKVDASGDEVPPLRETAGVKLVERRRSVLSGRPVSCSHRETRIKSRRNHAEKWDFQSWHDWRFHVRRFHFSSPSFPAFHYEKDVYGVSIIVIWCSPIFRSWKFSLKILVKRILIQLKILHFYSKFHYMFKCNKFILNIITY